MLGSDKWKWHVTDKIFTYLESGDDDDLKTATMKLTKYELMEKLSILGLAIWKQHILGNVFLTMQEARDYWVLEEGLDTKNISFSDVLLAVWP